ncbi:MAG: heavy metal translocating P-type ATPase [Bosea sp. (in: a-proteobacteria)]
MDDVDLSPKRLIVAFPLLGLVTGGLLALSGRSDWASLAWTAATLPVLAFLCIEIVISLRRGEIGLDIVAALSMSAALIFGETLAAAVVALMYAGGQHLEDYASRRARREMTALLGRTPRTVMRHQPEGLREVATESVIPGDLLMIRRGEVTPVDGIVSQGVAVLDQSALTGESLPQRFGVGEALPSGAGNVGGAFDMVATHRAADSVYAGIVRLVDEAQRSKAPMARLADRYAMLFLLTTVLIALAAWYWTGDPIRAVAVLVVATPCPLLLAVPIALVAGMSRAAKHGILIKGGRALEGLARIRVIVLDKTGTLTDGRPQVEEIVAQPGFSPETVLTLAASLDQASKHVVAQTLVSEARRRGLTLAMPEEAEETPGEGLSGSVAGRAVVVGGYDFVLSHLGGCRAADAPAHRKAAGAMLVSVAIDERYAGSILLTDRLRDGTKALLASLRAQGITRLVLATGDREAVAQGIASGLGLDRVVADLTPSRKIDIVKQERSHGPVMMVGDGVNDAPALAAADIGVAMGARGSAASAEAADLVLLVDKLDRIASALSIASHSRRVAVQSVLAGIGLSILGMIAAAFGLITPVQGALLQEAIDVAVILNALRARGDA